MENVLDVKIEDLDISDSLKLLLEMHDFETVEDIVAYRKDEFLNTCGITEIKEYWDEIVYALDKLNLKYDIYGWTDKTTGIDPVLGF